MKNKKPTKKATKKKSPKRTAKRTIGDSFLKPASFDPATDIEDLKLRISNLAESVSTHQSLISANVASVNTTFSEITASLVGVNARILELEAAKTSLEARVDELEKRNRQSDEHAKVLTERLKAFSTDSSTSPTACEPSSACAAETPAPG